MRYDEALYLYIKLAVSSLQIGRQSRMVAQVGYLIKSVLQPSLVNGSGSGFGREKSVESTCEKPLSSSAQSISRGRHIRLLCICNSPALKRTHVQRFNPGIEKAICPMQK